MSNTKRNVLVIYEHGHEGVKSWYLLLSLSAAEYSKACLCHRHYFDEGGTPPANVVDALAWLSNALEAREEEFSMDNPLEFTGNITVIVTGFIF